MLEVSNPIVSSSATFNGRNTDKTFNQETRRLSDLKASVFPD